jgi:ribonucleoside-diphosphate reductase alpha chain
MKFMENTVRSAIKGRAIGIGLLGWHTLLQSKSLPFASVASTALRKMVSKFIYEESIKASKEQAVLFGEPEWCKGTGLRHTHHIAIAPTISNAQISGGVSPSIEPIPANVYNLKTAKGTFIKKNPLLEKLLDSSGHISGKITKAFGGTSSFFIIGQLYFKYGSIDCCKKSEGSYKILQLPGSTTLAICTS